MTSRSGVPKIVYQPVFWGTGSSVSWFLRYKYLNHGQFQATNIMSPNTELGRKTQQYIILALWNQEQDGTHSLIFRLWGNLIYHNDTRQRPWLDLLKTFTLEQRYHFQGLEGSKKKNRFSSRSWCRANEVHNYCEEAVIPLVKKTGVPTCMESSR